LSETETIIQQMSSVDETTMDYVGYDVPHILAYKPTMFGSVWTFKLWGSAYTQVMPHMTAIGLYMGL